MHTIVYILQWGDMVNVLNIGYMWGKQAHTGYSYWSLYIHVKYVMVIT